MLMHHLGRVPSLAAQQVLVQLVGTIGSRFALTGELGKVTTEPVSGVV